MQFLYKIVQPNIQTTNQNMDVWKFDMNIHDSLMQTLDFQALSLILYSLSLNPRSSVRTAENAERTTTFVMFRISGLADIPEILNGLSNSWKQETSFDTLFSLTLNLDTSTTIHCSLAHRWSVCFKCWRWRVWSPAASYHKTSADGDRKLHCQSPGKSLVATTKVRNVVLWAVNRNCKNLNHTQH